MSVPFDVVRRLPSALAEIFCLVVIVVELFYGAQRWTATAAESSRVRRSATPSPGAVYQDPREICDAETFQPMCADGEVVVMTEAVYGRMTIGRCVRTDYGYVGCKATVLSYLDSTCSGRRSCQLRIPDQGLQNAVAEQCPREFKTYLNASYDCYEVETMACQSCGSLGVAHVTRQAGYVASVITSETQSSTSCGSSKCPWKIEVQSGQTINVTLLDFALEQRSAAAAAGPGAAAGAGYVTAENCFRYAVIKEAPSHRSFPVCGGHGRMQLVYSSVTNVIEIHVVSPEVFSQKGQFLIFYEAVGCPDFTVPPKAELKREGDRVTVTCEEDRTLSWQRRCVGTQWVGELGTCPGSHRTGESQQAPGPLPIGVLIAIVLGIALVIGVLIVTIGVVCLKRQRNDYARPMQPAYYVTGGQCYELREEMQHQLAAYETAMAARFAGQQPKFGGTLPPPKPPRPGLDRQQSGPAGIPAARAPSVRGGAGRENVYAASRMDQRPLPSIPNIPEATAAGASVRPPTCPDQCPCHPAAGRPVQSRPGVVRSPSRDGGDRPGGRIPVVACSVAASGQPQQHYTVLDPNEVQQLLASGGGGVCGAPACQSTAADMNAACSPYGPASFQFLSSDDVASCGSPSTNGGQDMTAGSSCNEIPLRPARESSQPRIDAASSGSSGNSSWP